MSNPPDIQASLENADEIAELTGRTKSDVIADLLDDGKLNNSNAIKENTSAIDRATEMAGKTHKLLTALIPILILLSTSGLELTGIIDLTPVGDEEDEEGWIWEDEEGNEYDDMIWGCTNDAAENYDPEANVDDGSCIPYEEDCEPFYYDNYTVYTNNQTEIQFNYDVDINCDEEQEVEVQFLVYKTNSTNGDMPENYSIDIWNVYNGDVGYRNITLGNFTTGYYDVYSYLINDDGEMITELIWYDVELLTRDE
tara:strand:- start:2232 stop:2993 length:762 start_codon:yes stop_codon:yes gene_type:complete